MERISRCLAAALACLLAMAAPGGPGTVKARESRAQALTVSPREIDLGVVGPGEKARAQFQIANAGEGRIRWAIEEPSGWESLAGWGLTGECGSVPSRVEVTLSSLKGRPEPGDHAV